MKEKTRMIGLVVTLFLCVIWFIAVVVWFVSPKVTCVTEKNNGFEKVTCFNSTKEAHDYLKERSEKINKEKYFINNNVFDYPIIFNESWDSSSLSNSSSSLS